jgi:hypothetical protein
MAFDLPHYSRYKETSRIIWRDSETFGLYQIQDRLQSLEIKELINIKVTSGLAGRPDLIANEHYGTPYYSWIIVMHNSPLNPIGWPRQGSVISIPNPFVVDDIIHG